ncbi:substrate-binding periplasmic protein [Thalassospira marina]|uniref:ABC transporter substrate-binding protein n=1 Tax=Thalassospira marina TaxID=2048283 RepID=A0ABN5FHV0_9PROT|nr:ABC transporter substrate-binding protein [Thalassospira marina]AUG54671.1 ABC transporter substrate-binding protein [Thalassospira marina]
MGQKKRGFFCLTGWTGTVLLLLVSLTGQGLAQTENPAAKAVKSSPQMMPYVLHQSFPRNAGEGRPEQLFFDELARALFKDAGLSFSEQDQQPWKRAYQETLYGPRHVIYPTTRTTDRENDLKWAGPISRTFWNLYGRKDAGWTDQKLADIFASARIGVAMGSAREDYLRKRGAKNIVSVPRDDQLFAMLQAERIDVVAMGAASVDFFSNDPENQGIELGRLASYRVCYLYFALSKDSANGDVAKLQNSLEAFYQDGRFLAMRRDFDLSADPDSEFIQALADPKNRDIGCVDIE